MSLGQVILLGYLKEGMSYANAEKLFSISEHGMLHHKKW